MPLAGIFRPGMRTYFIPFAAGIALVVSTFLPWVSVGDITMVGIPDVAAIWVAGLGGLAAVLAMLSLITRKNSRHPLLVVGLIALGITFLSMKVMPAAVRERALTASQAFSIVEGRPFDEVPAALVGSGIYLGIASSIVLVAFGMTIVVKRVAQPYAVASQDDDV